MPGFSETYGETDRLSDELARAFTALHGIGVCSRELYSQILFQTLKSHPGILSVWTVWEPNALDGDDRSYRLKPGHDASGRFVLCWHRAGGEPMLVPVAGYEDPIRGDWYWTPKRSLSTCWLDPIDYHFGTLRVCISGQISPILCMGRFLGAVGVDYKAHSTGVRQKLCHTAGHQRAITMPLREYILNDLTPREREVFHWLEQGKTNEEIGIILSISHHTVKNHLERVFQKLGVHNRREAVLSTH